MFSVKRSCFTKISGVKVIPSPCAVSTRAVSILEQVIDVSGRKLLVSKIL